MATVIDALLVTLGLDASNFSKGVEQAEKSQEKISAAAKKAEKERLEIEKKEKAARDQRAKEVDAGVKRTVQGFEKMRGEALGFFSALMGASSITGFLSNVIGTAAGLDRVSANLGMSAKDLSMWQLANERAGGSAEGMTAQLKESASEIAKYKSGMGPSEGMQWFLRLGGDPAAFKDGNTYLLERAELLKNIYKIDPTKAALMAANMGISEDSFNLLKNGKKGVGDLRQAQSRLADEMARNAPGAEELRKKINDLKNEFTALGVKVLPVVMPLLERLAAWLIDIAPVVESFAKKVDRIVEAMGGWGVVLTAIGGLKLVAMASGLSAIGLALSGIAATFAVIGGVVGAAALATLTGLGLATASTGLNAGEDEELARRRKMAPTIDGPNGRRAGGLASPAPTQSTTKSSDLFAALEARHGLPAGLLDSVWKQESGRGKNMTSPVGAQGHFQFMPATAKQYGLKDPNDLTESAGAAARMYADLLRQNGGDLKRALAGYNWGQGNLQRKGMGALPAETRNYIASVTGRLGAGNAQRGNMQNSTSTTDVKVGQITINTKATDAAGIAASIGPAVTNYAFVSQANGGM